LKNRTRMYRNGEGIDRHPNSPMSLPLYRLITLYQLIHDALHGKSGQEKTLKLQYLKTDKEGVLGWVRTFLQRLED